MPDLSKIRDFAHYAHNYLHIKTNMPGPDGRSDERIIPFIFNECQWKLHHLFERLLKEIGYVRIIILKARREGMSTYIAGRIFHRVHTTPNTNAFVIAHDKESTANIFDMSRLFYDMLPKSLKPMKRYSSRKELVFENPNDRSRLFNPGLRSKIEVFTANKTTSSRSGGYSCAHFSEVAFYPNAEELISATVPTIPDSPGSIIVYESTALGRGGFFYEEWLKATEERGRRTNFIPIFFSWLEFAGYSKPFTDGCSERELLATLDDEEELLTRKHGATPEQLHWRRHKILDLGDLELFHREYPTTPEEAFISSGVPYFSRTRLRELSLRCSPPTFVGDITNFGLVRNDDGPLKVWAHPERGYDYVIGVDPKAGDSEEGDYAAIEVLKVPKGVPYIEQVAEWVGYLDPIALAGRVIALARYYNDAMVSPEINAGGGGLTCLNEIKEHYWNIYRWQYFDRFGKALSSKIGWETNVSTKPLLCDYTSACLNSDILIIRSEDLISEMFTFIKRPTGGGEADAGAHDDRVMAYMIALFTLAHTYQSSSLLRELGIVAPQSKFPNSTTENPPPQPDYWRIDSTFLPSSRSSYYSGDRAWLNY